jgi:hypothetical protein
MNDSFCGVLARARNVRSNGAFCKVALLCVLLTSFGVCKALSATSGVTGKYYGAALWSATCSEPANTVTVTGPFSMRLKTMKDGSVTGSAQLSGTSSGTTWLAELSFTNLTLTSSNAISGSCGFKVYANSALIRQGEGSMSGELRIPAAMITGMGSNGGCVVQWKMSDGREYFPLDVGNLWRSYQTATDGMTTQDVFMSDTVTGTTTFQGQPTIVVTETMLTDPTSPFQIYRSLDDRGLQYLGNDDPSDPLTPMIAPYREALLPGRAGLKWTPYRRSNAVYNEDLDGDGLPETANIQGKSVYGAFEDVETPVGRFENCLRLDTQIKVTLRLSGIRRSARVTATESQWFAYGVGPVRSLTTMTIGSKPPAISSMTQELTGYRINGVGRGIVGDMIVATNLTTADSDTYRPSPPNTASDGTNFLVVTTQDYLQPQTVMGILIFGEGQVLKQFTIAEQASSPRVKFAGANYLVTWYSNGVNTGQFISPTGAVVGNPFLIPGTYGVENMAFDGERFLLISAQFTNGQYDIAGAFVSTNGDVSEQFFIAQLPGEQVYPRVVFNGMYYLVAWRDTRSGSGPASDTDIYGARVTPDGDVLDTNGVAMVTTTEVEEPQGWAVDGQGRTLLVWTAGGNVRAKRFAQDGTPLDGPVDSSGLLVSTGTDAGDPCVAFDGNNYVVAYSRGSYFPPNGMYFSRVTPGGTLLDAQGILVRSPSETTERLLHPSLAAVNGHLLLVWLDNRETYGELKSISGVLLYPF